MIKLFTKSYEKDFPWLKLAIKSVLKTCTEPVEWRIVVEDGERSNFQPYLDQALQEANGTSRVIHVSEASEHFPESLQIQSGYLRQQWIKMVSHRVMGNDFYLNWDSDVIATKPFYSKSFCNKDGKPIYWFSQLNHLILTGEQDRPAHEQRRAITEMVLGYKPSFEWMRCMPVPMIGQILSHASGQPEWTRAFQILASGDHRFSEFNVIGQFCHLYYPNAFDWRNAENNGPTFSGGYVEGGVGSGQFQDHAIVCQGWSYGGIPAHIEKFVNDL